MFKKTALIAGIGLALSATAQADYRFQVDGGYAQTSFDLQTRNPNDGKADPDLDNYNIGGTWYMEAVDTSKGPLGEAAFLDHASSLSLGFAEDEVSINGADDPDAQVYNVDMRYVAEGPGWKLSGWLMEVGYQRTENDDANVDTWSAGIGKYLGQNTSLVALYENISVDNGGDVDRWGAELEHFFPFDNGGLKARLAGGKTVVSGLDDPTRWGLGGTWYIGNNWGISLDFAQDDLNGYEIDRYGAGVEWFITENFAVDLTYEDVEFDDIEGIAGLLPGQKIEASYDTIGINALYRF